MKSMDIARKSYAINVENGQMINKGKLASTLTKYRSQILEYDKNNPTPFNTMEIQLINADKLQFHQDAVLRDFVEASARIGLRVEVFDLKTQKLLIEPRGDIIPTVPK